MTDRELLELAAKSAGIALADWNDGAEPYSSGIGFILPSNRMWNPLTDDGDALRLAVDLGLVVDCSRPSAGGPFKPHAIWRDDTMSNSDLTRHAIVRAAAEIGKGMQ